MGGVLGGVLEKPKKYTPPASKGRANRRKYKPRSVQTGKGRAAGYGKDWEAYRWRFLHYNKFCYCCGGKATVVDHIVAHKGDTDVFENNTNHLPMCTSCHNTATAKYDKFNPPKTEEKMKWIASRRERFKVNIAVKVIPYRKKK